MLNLDEVYVALWSRTSLAVSIETVEDMIAKNIVSLRKQSDSDWLVVGMSENIEKVRTIASAFQDARNNAQ